MLMEESKIFELRGELLKRGYTMAAFAREIGVSPQTLHTVLRRYWGTQKEPNGRRGYAILTALREFIASQN